MKSSRPEPVDPAAALIRAEWFRWLVATQGAPADVADRKNPVWDGGTGKFGRNYANVWNKVAALVRSKGFDPEDYVRAFFRLQNPGKKTTPNSLLSAEAEKRYQEYLEHSRSDVLADVKTQATAFASAMLFAEQLYGDDHRRAAAYVLGDRTVILSSLFRYCLALKYDLPLTAKRWEERAARQFRLDPDGYEAAWAKLLPAYYRARALGAWSVDSAPSQ